MASFALSHMAMNQPTRVAPRQIQSPAASSVVACASPLSAKASAFTGVPGVRGKFAPAAVRISARRECMKPQAMARFETERTYVMVKPDGVQRGLVGNIISRFETKGFQLKGLKLFNCPKELAENHYGDLSEKPFFPDLVDYIISGPVVCMVWEGPGVVKSARKLIGATNPLESEPGTIRGDLAIEVGRNVVHGSDSVENGEKEIGLWFGDEGVIEWDQAMLPWLRE